MTQKTVRFNRVPFLSVLESIYFAQLITVFDYLLSVAVVTGTDAAFAAML